MSELTPCKTCKKEVARTAPVCPHCGVKHPGLLPKDYVFGVGGLAVLLLVGYFFFFKDDADDGGTDSPIYSAVSTSEPTSDEMRRAAHIVCRNFVEQRLKAPSTAEFPLLDYTVRDLSDGYIVESYVDAQNSYGAQIRSPYFCTVSFHGTDRLDPSHWRLAHLKIIE